MVIHIDCGNNKLPIFNDIKFFPKGVRKVVPIRLELADDHAIVCYADYAEVVVPMEHEADHGFMYKFALAVYAP